MKDTLVVLVTCTLEPTRMKALEAVVENLNSMSDSAFKQDTLVFDNASTYPGSLNILTDSFPDVVRCTKNVGFWSAINWCIKNHERVKGRKYKYLNVVESDMIHFSNAFQRLADCESFLDTNSDVGFIRTEEFSVKNRHLYDKRSQHPDSKRYAWVVQDNFIERKPVSFELADASARIYKCNFLAKVPVISRMVAMEEIFDQLSSMTKFNEMDYQAAYYQRYPVSAILDDGIWESRLGNENPNSIVTGSWSVDESVGYKSTRADSITVVSDGEVVKV